MLFTNTHSKGLDTGFPDPCKTPPNGVPVPYPNFAKGTVARPNQRKLLVKGKPVHNLRTKKKN
ncbi:PAAR-like domain-containing protein [Taylorella asinigenitalis]|uniref:PAAR-like domain-containing protein n=1 Tax=Taylorella asinigenitalis TaxID=84590 RepID=UPI000679226D|nr:PAAR-like domain-containing protein [Taylorella asinigenitalis]